MRTTLGLSLLSLLALPGCPDRTISAVNPDQETVEVKNIPANVNRDLDILFLIDKSPTMADEQAALTANFPRFMRVLEQIEGGLPNVHIGVISQDIGAGGVASDVSCRGTGDNGNLLSTPRVAGCSPPNGAFISDVAGTPGGPRVRNYTGSLEDTFSCIATLGPTGCGFEQHLGSLKKALIGNPANAGFLRDDALLAVIIISDEDDCTAADPRIYDNNPSLIGQLGPFADFRCFEWGWECDQGTMSRGPGTYTNCKPRNNSPYLAHPNDLVDQIKSLKANPKDIIVSTIIGPSALTSTPNEPLTRVALSQSGVPSVQPSCTNGMQNAFPMPRLAHFAEQFPLHSFYSLCNDDLGAGLVEIAQLIFRRIGNPCFENDVEFRDIDPANPGLQPECTAFDVLNPDSSNPTETLIPPCTMADETTPAANTAQPCWYIKPDPVKCETFPTQLKFVIHPEDRVPPTGTHTVAHCVTE